MRYNDAIRASTRVTTKYRHYGPMYDTVVATLPASPTVLEIGVANGGSLQAWRALLGPDARIIGVDLNPSATALRDEGFEIHVLDSGADASWDRLLDVIGRAVDLLVDDGGHTNVQQILAVRRGIDLVRDGGWIVLEDVHASFMHEFGNPSPFSAAHFVDELNHDLHRGHPRSSVTPRRPALAARITATLVTSSWVGLRVGAWAYDARDELTAGQDASLMDYDHRWDDAGGLRRWADRLPPPVRASLKRSALWIRESRTASGPYRADLGGPGAATPQDAPPD